MVGLAAGVAGTPGNAQDREADLKAQQDALFRRPQVVLDTGGHSSPARAIVFAPEGDRLISAGLDKVLRIWSLEGVGEGRTIRPTREFRLPIWRGYAGYVYAMVLSPVEMADQPGQRILAAAGLSARTPRGAIMLYQFPADTEHPNGKVVGVLPKATNDLPNPEGHGDAVACLAFSPDGRWLASGGNDGRVIIWDVAARAVVRILSNPDPANPGGDALPVNALAFTPDGGRLIAGGGAGVVRIWETCSGQLIATSPVPAGDPEALVVTSLVVDPLAGKWFVIGREDGRLIQGQTADLRRAELLPVDATRGPIEALAVSPDGSTLALSALARGIEQAAERPTLDCVVELRSLPDGQLIRTVRTTDNLVHTLAFSPDGHRLAFAGGDGQALHMVDVNHHPDVEEAPPTPVEVSVQGDGRTIWDVGWTGDSRTVAFARTRPDTPEGPRELYEAFELFEREYRTLPRTVLRGAVETWEGWTVRAVDHLTLELTDPRGQARRIALDPLGERRWWAHTFLAPVPEAGHSQPVLAVATEGGVLLYDLTGKKLRHFDGHEGPVYCLAPSPDGRWLATGSADQTVRLWRLAGCDQPATMGMTLREEPPGTWTVATVDPLGFADRDRMRLQPGDILDFAGVGPTLIWRTNFHEWLKAANDAPPKSNIQAIIRRGGKFAGVMTSKRDNAVLSLFVGLDREWVLWMPEGYYETSIHGDRRYLKWHRNGPDIDQPTDIFPADRFERELRRPDVLAILVQTADLAQALAAVPAEARDPEMLVAGGAPPIVEVEAPSAVDPDAALVAAAAAIRIAPTVRADDGRSPIREVRIQVDGLTVGEPRVFDPPVQEFTEAFDVPLGSGTQRVNVVATNDQGRSRVVGIDVDRPEPPESKPRFAVLGIGVPGPFPDAEIRPIDFAGLDATDVSLGYARLAGAAFDAEQVITIPPVVDTSATSSAIREAFEHVASLKLGLGETLLVLLETHFAMVDGEGVFVGTDSRAFLDSPSQIPASDLAERLGEIASGGCRVVVLLDAVHEGAPRSWERGFREWVRGVRDRDVIPFIASNSGPSERLTTRSHGAFAEGLLELTSNPDLTLNEFRELVIAEIKGLTSNRQQAYCYFPEVIAPGSHLFAPTVGEGGD